MMMSPIRFRTWVSSPHATALVSIRRGPRTTASQRAGGPSGTRLVSCRRLTAGCYESKSVRFADLAGIETADSARPFRPPKSIVITQGAERSHWFGERRYRVHRDRYCRIGGRQMDSVNLKCSCKFALCSVGGRRLNETKAS
jgi:hypothetical protein